MRNKIISTCTTAALILSSMLTALPFRTASAADSETLSTASETSAEAELLTFDELYDLEEDELEQYCSEHGLKYMSKEEAEQKLTYKNSVWVNVKLKDYMFSGVDDVLESEDLNAFNRKNYYDYDFEKMTADLNMPEEYYKIDASDNDFSFSKNSDQTFTKFAAITIKPDLSIEDESSVARLYQLINVWAGQNPIVYTGLTFRFGPAPDGPVENEVPDTLGDVNSDGHINAVDASSVLSYYACISTNQKGEYNDEQKLAADVNQDRMINAIDASFILSYYAYTATTEQDIMPIAEYLKKN